MFGIEKKEEKNGVIPLFFYIFADERKTLAMKVLVTGGTGYIGSHTATELLKAGYEVVILDNLSNSYRWISERIEKITGKPVPFECVDILDEKTLDECLGRNEGIAAVVHFAALKAVGESVEMPLRYYRNNISGLINLLDAMERHQIRNLIFSSSCTVYGEATNLPVDETAPLQPAMSPYGNTKRISEEIIRDTVEVTGLRAVSLRYFNPVGAHESALIGELPIGTPNNLMPYITQTANGLRDHLRVFGNDYPTPDGTAIRDYIHVTDLALAHVKAVERMLSEQQASSWEVFNLGTGRGYSVLEMINAFESATGVKVPWQFAPRRPGDITAIWADASLANRELGWRAERGVDEMAESAWRWELMVND